ncbi:MAG: DUF1697 domain-containing protein [Thermomicrobiales bacterium]
MNRYVALLRGINVGGNAKVPMADLREIAGSLGWTEISTHLNTGNLFFTTDETDEVALGSQLTNAIADRMNFAPPTLVRTLTELQRAAAFCRKAFPHELDKQVAIAFLSERPSSPIDDLLQGEVEEHCGNERFVALFYPNGQGKSRLDAARLERLLGVTVTVRGILTVEALISRFE